MKITELMVALARFSEVCKACSALIEAGLITQDKAIAMQKNYLDERPEFKTEIEARLQTFNPKA